MTDNIAAIPRESKSLMRKQRKINPVEWLMRLAALVGIVAILFIVFFVFFKAAPVIGASGVNLITRKGFDKEIQAAFDAAADEPMQKFGMLGLIVGTLYSTVLALLFAGIIGVGAAITIQELAPHCVSRVFLWIIRLMASIPSIVYGLVGIVIVEPFIYNTFVTDELRLKFGSLPIGERFQIGSGGGLLASVIVLKFMIAPMVITLSADALASVPKVYRETGHAFGMSRFRIIRKILLPSAKDGIVAGFLLAAGRGIGEAVALSLVCGSIGFIPNFKYGIGSLLAPILPLASAIINKSEAMGPPAVDSALFTCGAILLVFGILFSIAARFVTRKKVGANEY